MKSLVSRLSLLGAMVMFGCASLPAQDPDPVREVRYSAEELDNLVAPVALYPDALLAQILVAATFPDQIALAAQYVRERGTRNIEDQGWDISVKAVAYYPPVLNMLARDDDWTVALGQAYASQSADVMDAVQRLREMAREQGNLVSTREHTVTEDRGRIIIVPANPQVIYVPTYDPAIVYVRPIFSFGFHTGYFSFGLGFPIGSWLVYDCDWWGRRVYYDGWYGDGWRYYARSHFDWYPVYRRPRYSVVNININIFSRRVNYINLDRRHRYVRRTVEFERHYRGDRYADRDRDRNAWRDDDRRGPITRSGDDGSRDGSRDRNGGNDRIGNRIATFDDYRPDKGGTGSDARDAEPANRSGFDGVERQKENGSTRGNGAEYRGRPDVPVFTSQPRAGESSKARGNGNSQAESRRPEVPVFTSQPRATGSGKSKGNGSQSEFRRPEVPIYSSQPRSTGRTSSGGGQSEYRGSRPNAPVFSAPERSTGKSSGNGRAEVYRGSSRQNAPVFSAPQRSVERKSSGAGGGGGAATFSRPSGSGRVQSGGGGGGGSSARVQSGGGGGGGKVKSSGGGGSTRSGSGKGRKQ